MKYADIVIHSNVVYTGLSDQPQEASIAIGNQQIIKIGSDMEMQPFIGPDTKCYDFQNKLVMPGFIDCHLHFFMGAMFMSKHYLDLSEAKSEKECAHLLAEHLKKHPNIDHVTGWGWFLMNWEDKTPPSKQSLDEVAPHTPVYMFCADGHTCWLNSCALDKCGVTKNTEVKFGSIGRQKNGELDGLLYEIDAESYIMDQAIAISEEEWPEVCKAIFQYIARSGITSVADLSTNPTLFKEPESYEKLLTARKNNALTARVYLYPSLGDHPDFTIAEEIRKKYCYDDLCCAGLKQFVDGTTSLYSGCLLAPYTDRPEEKGFSNYPPSLYEEMVAEANKKGFDVKLHSIGDGAVRIALDATEHARKEENARSCRNSVEHCESIDPADISRFAELGAIASVQPTHLLLDVNEKIERIGVERCRYEWPFKSLLEAGATLAFSTDYPVYELNPMIGIYGAITRCQPDGSPTGANPQEKISLAEALRAYTYGSAYSLNKEKEIGTLEEGKFADIVILDKNLFDLTPEEMLKVTPILTIMNGKIVYHNDLITD